MKKLLFLFMLIGAGLQLKAQSKFEMQPFNKLPDNLVKKFNFTLPDSLARLMPQKPSSVNPQVINGYKPTLGKQYAYNPMPVIKMNGRSNMPVVKMEGNSRMSVFNPDTGINSLLSK